MGEADIFLAEELLDLTIAEIPDGLSEKVIGKKMGHYPMFEQPEALAQIVMDFLQRKRVI
jgi:pimeloyl-ACP methyl ester carboxylesterase